ncbi:MAG: hypothetical protein FJ267_18695 [Planctomycetes bacterium]|nr:hypothetical protein [Planctomycetota bacterium]
MPHGSHTFLNIPLEIGGNLPLWGQMNANRGQVFAEKVTDIAVERTFESLYVYHATFFQSDEGTPVYDIVFRYSGGSFEKERVLYGDDVRDWYHFDGTEALPSDPRSKLAWHGYHAEGDVIQPLRFCLTAIDNPNPELKVMSIDLVSCKQASAGCVMAMTTGKSGLIP